MTYREQLNKVNEFGGIVAMNKYSFISKAVCYM